jgi:hypothetical protein
MARLYGMFPAHRQHAAQLDRGLLKGDRKGRFQGDDFCILALSAKRRL